MHDGESEDNASHQDMGLVASYEALEVAAQPQFLPDNSPSQRLVALGFPKDLLDPMPREDLSTIIAFCEAQHDTSLATWFSGIFSPEELANAAIAMRKAITGAGNIDGVT